MEEGQEEYADGRRRSFTPEMRRSMLLAYRRAKAAGRKTKLTVKIATMLQQAIKEEEAAS